MLPDDLTRRGEHVMTVCNSCRYCEAYCPVFPAVEQRLVFTPGDLAYLANLCHNCGECLYACQYAPPHEFGINVPKTLAELRVATYEEYCWPRAFAVAFRRHGVVAPLVMVLALATLMLASSRSLRTAGLAGDFYRVLPHDLMVLIFAGVSLFVVAALIIGFIRFWRHIEGPSRSVTSPSDLLTAFQDALTLRHLHSDDDGVNCTDAEERRSPWRRWFHHFTVYGYLLCFASTSVAAVYHSWLKWRAPYPYTSLPVVLGTLGGLGLLVGPAGLLALKGRRDPALGDPRQRGLDVSFIVLLFGTSLTGLMLLIWREGSAMGPLLIVHLAFVLTLFVTMPYGKFVHGIYRVAALAKYAREESHGIGDREPGRIAPRQPVPASAAVARDRRPATAPAATAVRLHRKQPTLGER